MSSEDDSYSYQEGNAFYGRYTGELHFAAPKSRSGSNIENFSDFLGDLKDTSTDQLPQAPLSKRVNLAEIKFKSPKRRKIKTRQFQADYSPIDAPITDYKIKTPSRTDSKMKEAIGQSSSPIVPNKDGNKGFFTANKTENKDIEQLLGYFTSLKKHGLGMDEEAVPSPTSPNNKNEDNDKKGVTFKQGENLEIREEEGDGFFDNLEFGNIDDQFQLELNENGLYKSTPPQISQRLTLESIRKEEKIKKGKKVKKIVKPKNTSKNGKNENEKPKGKRGRPKKKEDPQIESHNIRARGTSKSKSRGRRRRFSSEDEIIELKDFRKSMKKLRKEKMMRTKRASTVKPKKQDRANKKQVKRS